MYSHNVTVPNYSQLMTVFMDIWLTNEEGFARGLLTQGLKAYVTSRVPWTVMQHFHCYSNNISRLNTISNCHTYLWQSVAVSHQLLSLMPRKLLCSYCLIGKYSRNQIWCLVFRRWKIKVYIWQLVGSLNVLTDIILCSTDNHQLSHQYFNYSVCVNYKNRQILILPAILLTGHFSSIHSNNAVT